MNYFLFVLLLPLFIFAQDTDTDLKTKLEKHYQDWIYYKKDWDIFQNIENNDKALNTHYQKLKVRSPHYYQIMKDGLQEELYFLTVNILKNEISIVKSKNHSIDKKYQNDALLKVFHYMLASDWQEKQRKVLQGFLKQFLIEISQFKIADNFTAGTLVASVWLSTVERNKFQRFIMVQLSLSKKYYKMVNFLMDWHQYSISSQAKNYILINIQLILENWFLLNPDKKQLKSIMKKLKSLLIKGK